MPTNESQKTMFRLFTSWLFLLLLFITPTSVLEVIVHNFDTIVAETDNRKLKIRMKSKAKRQPQQESEEEDDNVEDNEAHEGPAYFERTANVIFEMAPTPPTSPPSSTPTSPPRPRRPMSIGRGRGRTMKVHPYIKKER